MELEYIISLATVALSDINFILAMLIIVMVSACFLGRYIVITRKMVIATLGVLVLQILFLLLRIVILKYSFPELYEQLSSMSAKESIAETDPNYRAYVMFSVVSSYLLNGVIFLYAFIFYLLAYKEKKVLRAIEATVCLYLYYFYINNIIQYSFMYFSSANFSDLVDAIYGTSGAASIRFQAILMISVFVVSLVLLLLIYFKYYKKKKYYSIRVRDRILFIIWLFIFAFAPALPFGYEKLEERYKMLSSLFACLLPILGGIAPVLLVMNTVEKSLNEKNEYQEEYIAAELDYIEQYKRTQTETRAFRHDIINNLTLTNMLMDEGKTEEAGQHLKDLLGNVSALSPSIITGDEMLDCIVAMKADKMKEIGIDFSEDGVVDGGLHMKAMDICSIFANALDNAIEAAGKCIPDQNANESSSGPKIEMIIKRTEKFFVIKISNSAKEKVDVNKLFMTMGYTSKDDKEHHGFGLRNIRQTVEEYDGLVKAESDEESFSLSIMLPR